MFSVLIVDDEPLARQRIKLFLRHSSLSDCEVIEASNGLEAIEKSLHDSIDLAFLDIRMPVMDGLECAAHLQKLSKPPAIIFVTAYDEFALKAFDVNAIAYLLKPIAKEKLFAVIDNAGRLNAVQIRNLNHTPNDNVFISSKVGDKLDLIAVSKVIYFKAENKCVWAVHENGTSLIDESLKYLEEHYPNHFFRVHRNALVAKDRICGLRKHGLVIKVQLDQNRYEVEVSRRTLVELKKLLKNTL